MQRDTLYVLATRGRRRALYILFYLTPTQMATRQNEGTTPLATPWGPWGCGRRRSAIRNFLDEFIGVWESAVRS